MSSNKQVQVTAGPAQMPAPGTSPVPGTNGNVRFGVGQAQIQPGLPSVPDALKTLSGQQQQGQQDITIPFMQFMVQVQHDPAKAEALVPGITSKKGYELLKAGPDGKPTVTISAAKAAQFNQLPKPTARQQLDQQIATTQQRHKVDALVGSGGKGVPEWITTEDFAKTIGAKSVSDMPPELLMHLMPGIEAANGKAPWIREGADGKQYLLNPRSPKFRQTQADILARQGGTPPDQGQP